MHSSTMVHVRCITRSAWLPICSTSEMLPIRALGETGNPNTRSSHSSRPHLSDLLLSFSTQCPRCCSGLTQLSAFPVLHDVLLCFEAGFKKCPFCLLFHLSHCTFCRLSSSSLDTSQEVLETTFSFMPCLKPP